MDVTTCKKNVNFEDSLKQLEALVTGMEKGDLSLEDSLKAFEEGIQIVRHCQQALQAAEQRVTILQTSQDVPEDDAL